MWDLTKIKQSSSPLWVWILWIPYNVRVHYRSHGWSTPSPLDIYHFSLYFLFHFSHCPFILTPPSITPFFRLGYYISRGHCWCLWAWLRICLYPEVAEPGPVHSKSGNPPLIHMILVITLHWIIQTPHICILPESYGWGNAMAMTDRWGHKKVILVGYIVFSYYSIVSL